jgi:hypothetical protein
MLNATLIVKSRQNNSAFNIQDSDVESYVEEQKCKSVVQTKFRRVSQKGLVYIDLCGSQIEPLDDVIHPHFLQ